MTSDRKRPGVAFLATVVVVVMLVAYPLCFGPAYRVSGVFVVMLKRTSIDVTPRHGAP